MKSATSAQMFTKNAIMRDHEDLYNHMVEVIENEIDKAVEHGRYSTSIHSSLLRWDGYRACDCYKLVLYELRCAGYKVWMDNGDFKISWWQRDE